MKSILRIALILTILAPFSAHAAIQANPPADSNPPSGSSQYPFAPKAAQPLTGSSGPGGQLGDSCEVLPCDTTHGYTCNSVTKVCDFTGIPTSTEQPSSGATGSSGSLSNPNNIFSGTTCTPACDTAHGYVCQSGICVPLNNLQQSLDRNANPNLSPSFVPLAPIPGLTADQNGNAFIGTFDLPVFLNSVYKYTIGLAAAIAVVMIVWGGIEIATEESIPIKMQGKRRIYNALFGLVLVLAPALVFGIINPAILNLSLNIPNLDVKQGAWTGGPVYIACQGANCSLAVQQCKAQMTPDSVNPILICQLPSGETLSPTNGNTASEVRCAKSTAVPKVQCNGIPNAGGANQAGTGGISGAIPLFDGQYMDVVKFIGSSAHQSALNYSCQATYQGTPKVFQGTGASSAYWYAVCLAPQLQYVNVNVDGTGAHADPATESIHSTYSGECRGANNALSDESLSRKIVERDALQQTKITCSSADKELGKNVTCFQVYSTCELSG